MNISRHRRRLTSIALWIPVSAIVAALFLVPSGDAAAPEQRRAGTLNVTPHNVYSPGHTTGGQLLTWSGDMGSGAQKIFMERRGSPTAKWTRVQDPAAGEDFSITTEADGSFSFEFPAPAMNACFFRLVSSSAETEAYQFSSVFQDVEVKGPTTAAVGVPYTLTGDTVLRAQDDRPIFPGRAAELQIRDVFGPGEWSTARNGTVGPDGKISFASITTNSPGTLVFRIRLADWNQDGDVVGWYPSLPFYVAVN